MQGRKHNVQRSVVFLLGDNTLFEKESKKTILFKIVSKRIMDLGRYFTKEVNDLHTENYKTLM